MDFTKAFDKVPHRELPFKLKLFGISGNLWLWSRHIYQDDINVFKSTLISDLLQVKSGVPQGNILGPILFLIYVTDLPYSLIHSSLLLYADDSKCFHPIKSISNSNLLRLDINSLAKWSDVWIMAFNE